MHITVDTQNFTEWWLNPLNLKLQIQDSSKKKLIAIHNNTRFTLMDTEKVKVWVKISL